MLLGRDRLHKDDKVQLLGREIVVKGYALYYLTDRSLELLREAMEED